MGNFSKSVFFFIKKVEINNKKKWKILSNVHNNKKIKTLFKALIKNVKFIKKKAIKIFFFKPNIISGNLDSFFFSFLK